MVCECTLWLTSLSGIHEAAVMQHGGAAKKREETFPHISFVLLSALWRLPQPSTGHGTQGFDRAATWSLIKDETDGDIEFQSLSVDLQHGKVAGLTCQGYQ